ncbi:Membrane protease YdiL, CAAX protease family [Halovenus aranensis]|uniref:Membrane protease YdiL, CAAX protease family n=1 Tax=Halovenus aranensis TaxID=890420 RepID=A0A1G8TQ92_9EURY|nr:CPBP family intramembrane glutamic endopeptidase [Halovenus aranensis]SDJ43085.1 Membrane protease YdiL, CAAX protease family [Halovenus aranensis]
MPAWGSFLVVSFVTVGTVLVLARRSQDTIDQVTPQSDAAVPTAVSDLSVRTDVSESAVRCPPTQVGDDTPETVLTPRLLLANVVVTQGAVALVIALSAWYFEIPGDAIGVTADVRAAVVGVVFGAVLWMANELATTVADAVGASYDEGVRQLLAPDSTGGWAVLFGVALPLIAVSEELLFRAALVGVPADGFGLNAWVLAGVSSVLFALGHGAQGRVGVAVTGTLGFVLAAGYVYTGSLLVVVTAHYVLNAVEFLVHELLEVDVLTPGR